jgi:hypothetical protein
LALAGVLQSRLGGVVGAKPTSSPEKSPLILQQKEHNETKTSTSVAEAASSQKKLPSLGRPFGRKV